MLVRLLLLPPPVPVVVVLVALVMPLMVYFITFCMGAYDPNNAKDKPNAMIYTCT